MEFYLIKQKRAFFHPFSEDNDQSTQNLTFSDEKLTLEFVTDRDKDLNQGFQNKEDRVEENSFRDDLMEILCKAGSIGHYDPRPKRLNLTVSVKMTSTNIGSVNIITRHMHGMSAIDALKETPVFDRVVKSALLKPNILFNVNLKLYLDGTPETECYQIKATDLTISEIGQGNWSYGISTTFKTADNNWQQWSTLGAVHEGEITLTMVLQSSAIPKLYFFRYLTNHFDGWPKHMLCDGTGSDMVILAGNENNKEKGIRCHKFVLSDRSPVFKKMMQTDMVESKENVVKIVDLSQQSIRAMLKFMYCWDIEEATKSCEIALELLLAGDRYDIQGLVPTVADIMCGMPCAWFSLDTAVKLLLFSRHIKLEKCQNRSLELLKWFSRNSGPLKDSLEYRNLFTKTPLVAMELAEIFLKM